MADTSPNQRFSAAARGTMQLIAARVFFMGSGYAAAVILARELGPAAYGTYGLVISLLLWLEVLSGFGIPRAAAKLISQTADPKSIVEATLAGLLAIGIILLALCWIAAPYVAGFFDIRGGTALLRLAVLDLPFNGLYIAYHGVLIGYQQFWQISVTLVVYSLSKLLGTLALFWIGFSVEAALIVNVLATVGALAYLLFKFRWRLVLPDRRLFRSILAIAAPLAVLVVTMQFVLSAHLWLLKRMGAATAEVLGFYIAALNIAQLPMIVPAALGIVILSSVAAALARNDFALAQRHVSNAGRFVVIVLAPVCVLGAIHATPIMSLLYSPTYEAGGIYLGILIGGYGLFALLDTLLHALIGADRHHLASALLLAILPVVFLSGIGLIQLWGPTGAAASLLVTLGAGAGLAAIAAYRRFHVLPVAPLTLARVAIATAVAALAGVQIESSGIAVLFELALLSGIYLLVLAALREIGPQDLKPFAVWKS